ncbi:MAG: FIST C-terminal domain-containing protein [Pseudomonadota bacterium]
MKTKSIGLSDIAGPDQITAELSLFSQEADGCSFVAIHHRENALDPIGLADAAGAVHCATSCNGIMSDTGLHDVGIFAISDPEGDYGTGCVSFNDNTFDAAREAVTIALRKAGREGEAPDLVWISITPGAEEDAILGIEAVIGKDVPIIGGSAADDAVAGGWSVSDGTVSHQSGLVVSVLFCSTPLHFAYQNGYEPTAHSGVVTKVEGRKLVEIDGTLAGDVYARWTGGAVPQALGAEAENILSQATLWPLGRKISSLGDVPYYLLAHPCNANPDGTIDLFAEVAEGETLTQMTGDKTALAARAGRVAEFALKSGSLAPDDVAGALVVYCGGCMLVVQDRLVDVYSGINTALENSPFLGVFTFGEQGPVYDAGNRHGNLMISCITFTKAK